MAVRKGRGGNDLLWGWDNDQLYGLGGDDTLDGRLGSVSMFGGENNDTYYVDDKRDFVIEVKDEGQDKVLSSIDYMLPANVEDLELTGTAVRGWGNDLANNIRGNELGNLLDGRGGADTMSGGGGSDTYVVNHADDKVIELFASGGDDDWVKSSITYTLGANVENLRLTGTAAINGYGNNEDNIIEGNGATNYLYGYDGDDILFGGGGFDWMRGGKDNDTYYVVDSGDVVVESADEGRDHVYSLREDYTLTANVENLTLLDSLPSFSDTAYEAPDTFPSSTDTYQAPVRGNGNSLNNRITGNSLDNTLRGEEGNDHLDGRDGADEMHGGRDQDTYVVDNVGDQVIELVAEGYDTVRAWIDYTLPANVEQLTLLGIADILGDGPGIGARNGTGNNLDNLIEGNSFANVIDGGRGNDQLLGDRDADTFVFDHIGEGGQQDVVLDFEVGIDRIDLSDTPVNDFNDLFTPGDRFMEQVGNDVIIHTSVSGGTSITLLNVQQSSLTAADFLF